MKKINGLNRGINLGGWLSQCVHTQEHYASFITEEDFARIAQMGFDHVRLPIDCEVIEAHDGTDRPAGYGFIDMAVKQSAANGMKLIIDLHKAYGYDFNDAGDAERNNLFTNETLQERFMSMWEKLAQHYGTCEHVFFELLNEVVETENNDAWNTLVEKVIARIRAIAPQRPIIYGGIMWNSASTLKLLRKPIFDNVIYTFHFYEPLIFTHQKAPWVKNMDMEKTVNYPADMDYYRAHSAQLGNQGETAVRSEAQTMGEEFIAKLMQEAIDAAEAADVPLYCGEFGVIDRAPVEDTLRWFVDMDNTFRRFDIGCAVWSYKKMDFGIIDEHYAPIYDRLLATWFRK
ncbi:MAG: glycoside hydrolase family 5 protein [Ruminococcaceae bacterium]|nr:glycoside hydrolase family 5 protein [Oscillospiraceae bacterium]